MDDMPPTSNDAITAAPLLRQALDACTRGIQAVFGYSLCINLLMLTAPLYMLQVFDRVIAGRSTETLLYLTLIAVVALLTLAALDVVRGRTMVKLGNWLDGRLSDPLFAGSIALAAEGPGEPSAQGLRDLSTLRGFLTGPSIFPILDAPWTPVFLIVIFLLHPLLGALALVGAVFLLGLAVANDLASRRLLVESNGASIKALNQADSATRNADAIMAMGIAGNLVRRWRQTNAQILDLQGRASYRSGLITAASKFFRMALQIGMLGVGAWLVLGAELTAGGMIAGSILLGRALAPVDQAMNSWKSALGARAAYERIKQQLSAMPRQSDAMPLPAPKGALRVENLVYAHPGAVDPILRGLNFQLEPGESLGIIGPTAAGKTTLARLLVGNVRPLSGHVRLDSADVWQWDSDDLGRHVGYLPQNVGLFAATVRENVARMGEAEGEAVVSAARMADVHDLVLQLPGGYETQIGEGGVALSGGQRQRIALARAVFGDPRFVVLDEPNSNLDHTGEAALLRALDKLNKNGVTTVVIAHRPSILRRVDKILVLQPDAAPVFGPRDEILRKVTGPATGRPVVNEPEEDHEHLEHA
jgi:PrtD family type I secretion system ABC transporter